MYTGEEENTKTHAVARVETTLRKAASEGRASHDPFRVAASRTQLPLPCSLFSVASLNLYLHPIMKKACPLDTINKSTSCTVSEPPPKGRPARAHLPLPGGATSGGILEALKSPAYSPTVCRKMDGSPVISRSCMTSSTKPCRWMGQST